MWRIRKLNIYGTTEMIYTHHVIALAKIFGKPLSVERNPDTNRFHIYIEEIVYKPKDAPIRQQIMGNGYTIEDSAYDFVRKARGGLLVHQISNQEVEVI